MHRRTLQVALALWMISASPASIEAPDGPPSRQRGRGARISRRGPPSTATPPSLVAFASFRQTRRKSNEGDGAVRAAARLNNSAGCRAFRSSVEARHRGFAAGRRMRLYLAYKKVDGTWAWNGGLVLEMRVESQGWT